MFLSRRSTQAEYFDAPARPVAEVANDYLQLARANRLFDFARPFEAALPRLLGTGRCRSLALLDLGGGDGALGRHLTRWAAQRGWEWNVANLDSSLLGLQLNPNGRNVAASALALPFRDNSFDVVIASQMTHHLVSDADVTGHFREAWRVTRDTLLLSDLHRNLMLCAVVWISTLALGMSPQFRSDGMLSVQRGFRVNEWQTLARQAGILDARVWVYYGARIMLQARKHPEK